MLREGVEWFGVNGGRGIDIVPPGEPPGCAGIRTQIAELDTHIADLAGQLTGNPCEDAQLRQEIRQVRDERTDLVTEGKEAGCAL